MSHYLTYASLSLLFISIIFLLLKGSRSLDGRLLILGLLVISAIEFCDMQALLFPADWLYWKKASFFAEGTLPCLFFAFSLQSNRSKGIANASWFSRILWFFSFGIPLFALAIPFDKVFYSPDFADEHLLFLGQAGFAFYILLVLYLTLVLSQFEKTFFALERAERWRVKFEILGLGFILCLFLLYYSQGILYRSLDMGLIPVRSAAVLVGLSLFFYSRLRRGEARSLVLSQNMALRSVVILAVGAYLVGLGLVGEGLRYFGESSQKVLFTIIGSFSGFVVVILLLSERLQRRLRIFLTTHFYKQKYDYRQQWYDFTSAISVAGSEVELNTAVLDFFCKSFSTQGGSLFLLDTESKDFVPVSHYEMMVWDHVIAGNGCLIEAIGCRDKVIDLKTRDYNFSADEVSFFEYCRIRFVVPLIFDDKLQGLLFLGQPINPEEEFSFEDFDLMKMLACQTTATLLSMRLSQELSSAKEMAAAGKVSTFVLHDLKNLVSNLSLVIDNARDYLDDPEFQQDMLDTLNSTVGKMNRLIARLKNLGGVVLLNRQDVDLFQLVKQTLGEYGGAEVRLSGKSVTVSIDSDEISRVLLNLLLNAKDASREDRPAVVDVEVGHQKDNAFVRVRDFGCGMSQEFLRSRLFKPFQTTKKKGFGIGLFQCRNIVEAHGGRIDVESSVGEGTTFSVYLPFR